MVESTRLFVQAVLAVAVILAPDWADATIGQEPTHLDNRRDAPRVRTGDPDISILIQRATVLSPTFRRLAEAIQATDGIVYVQRGRCGHRVHTCLLFWMTVAGSNRILRVVIGDSRNDIEAMTSVAHELRHALEVLEDPSVKTGTDMYFFFRLNRSIVGETFETLAATETGDAVYTELKRSRRRSHRPSPKSDGLDATKAD